jgi:hypothetical protein
MLSVFCPIIRRNFDVTKPLKTLTVKSENTVTAYKIERMTHK